MAGFKQALEHHTLSGYKEGINKARSAVSHNSKMLDKVNAWDKDKKYWARHELVNWKMTLGKRGSSNACRVKSLRSAFFLRRSVQPTPYPDSVPSTAR